jgi:spermidine/putrescine transport system substrate-binding protein
VSERGKPPKVAEVRMAIHNRSYQNRRRFLRQTALLAGTSVLGALLEACSQRIPEDPKRSVKIAAPSIPVTWDISSDNGPISDGLGPEKDGELHLYSYADYISPEAVDSFEDKFRVKVRISTFNNTDDALTKIQAGKADYDICTPSYDQIGQMVTDGLLRPLNHSYVPNIRNLWPVFSNPWYDQEWRYSVPYTVYTTGLGWRIDQISANIGKLPNPYEALWNPAFDRETALIDDWHTAMALVLLKLGIDDVNTSSADYLAKVADALRDMKEKTSPAVTATPYSDLAAGQISLAQMWSGDIILAKSFLPVGANVDILRYWFPADGKGLVDNDLMVVLRGGRNPVLAHLFLNHMLEPEVAKQNFSATGYQPPQLTLKPDSLVAEGLVPANLKAAVVKPEYFDVGYRILELDPTNDAAWHSIWRSFKTGRS